MQNFVRFHAVEYETELPQKFGENGIAALTTELCMPKLLHCYF